MIIIPYGTYLLVKIVEKPKKGSLIMVNEEEDPIVRCKLIDAGSEIDVEYNENYLLLFRRYELRDCVDKEGKVYLVKEEYLLGYEEIDPT